ncbi:hypothetical protein V6N11_079014 [Hibiscus sabdariffa]|uniref:Uncharacterized protein n=1 Tax=Hibiscus sabdariffa TaxID=183260 RepID=A0ABR2RU58_9ROSI
MNLAKSSAALLLPIIVGFVLLPHSCRKIQATERTNQKSFTSSEVIEMFSKKPLPPPYKTPPPPAEVAPPSSEPVFAPSLLS